MHALASSLTRPLTAALVVAVVVPGPARAASGCGAERAISRGRVFDIRVTGTGCRNGRLIARSWWVAQTDSAWEHRRVLYDGAGRRWTCRTAKRRVRCTHSARTVVRFAFS